MKRMERRCAAVAAWLLSVVLPMVLVVPFHHHEEEYSDFECELCAHHQPHEGHLASSSRIDNCLICQFLGVSYLPEASTSAPFVPDAKADVACQPVEACLAAPLQLHSSRAPPVSVC